MTEIPLKDIPNCLVENPTYSQQGYAYDACEEILRNQGEIRLTLSLEKLAKLIWIKMTQPSSQIIKDWDNNTPFAEKYWKPGYLSMADSILADLKDLIIVVK